MSEKWTVGYYRKDTNKPATDEEIKEMLCESVDLTRDHGNCAKDFFMVMLSIDEDEPIYAALVGNGPTSKERAYRIAKLPELEKHNEELRLSLELAEEHNVLITKQLEKQNESKSLQDPYHSETKKHHTRRQ